MPFVYILKSRKNGSYYIGSTNDIARRLSEHNSGQTKYTKAVGPFELVFSQEFASIIKARSIEYKLKKKKSRKIIEAIIADGIIKIG